MTPTQPNKTEASAEAMACMYEMVELDQPTLKERATIIDRHFAPLLAQNAALVAELASAKSLSGVRRDSLEDCIAEKKKSEEVWQARHAALQAQVEAAKGAVAALKLLETLLVDGYLVSSKDGKPRCRHAITQINSALADSVAAGLTAREGM